MVRTLYNRMHGTYGHICTACAYYTLVCIDPVSKCSCSLADLPFCASVCSRVWYLANDLAHPLVSKGHGWAVTSLLDATPPPNSGPKASRGGGGLWGGGGYPPRRASLRDLLVAASC